MKTRSNLTDCLCVSPPVLAQIVDCTVLRQLLETSERMRGDGDFRDDDCADAAGIPG